MKEGSSTTTGDNEKDVGRRISEKACDVALESDITMGRGHILYTSDLHVLCLNNVSHPVLFSNGCVINILNVHPFKSYEKRCAPSLGTYIFYIKMPKHVVISILYRLEKNKQFIFLFLKKRPSHI